MREILFKAKTVESGEWVQGYIVVEKGLFGKFYYIHEENSLRNYHEVVYETLCQYTGLQDKNGVKIFEGDVLTTKANQLLEVVYNENKAAFILKPYLHNFYHEWYFVIGADIEVIGNIHDKEQA